jgi:hypothetical protein
VNEDSAAADAGVSVETTWLVAPAACKASEAGAAGVAPPALRSFFVITPCYAYPMCSGIEQTACAPPCSNVPSQTHHSLCYAVLCWVVLLQCRVGDVVRATTAYTLQMSYPPMQLMFGGKHLSAVTVVTL